MCFMWVINNNAATKAFTKFSCTKTSNRTACTCRIADTALRSSPEVFSLTIITQCKLRKDFSIRLFLYKSSYLEGIICGKHCRVTDMNKLTVWILTKTPSHEINYSNFSFRISWWNVNN